MKARHLARRDAGREVRRSSRFRPTCVEKAKEYREQMIEAVSEFDDELFEKFIEGKPITERRDPRRHPQGDHRAEDLPGDLRLGVQEQGRPDHARCGGGLPALAARCSADRRARTSTIRTKVLTRKASDNEPFSALVFKIMTDPYVGQLAFFRVYSGKLNAGESVYNVAKGRKERIGRLVRMHANKREEIQEILAGDICAAVGLKTVSTGDTICDDNASDRARIDRLPDAGDSARGRAEDQGRPGKAGHGDSASWRRKIPPSRVEHDPETGQTILSGMGELHLEIIVDRMMREFGVGANVGKPQVAYRETIRQTAEVRLHAQEADRRQRPVRAREDARRAASRARASSS